MASKERAGSGWGSTEEEPLDNVDMSQIANQESDAENRSLESRRNLHALVDQQITQFLARGGKITEVDSNVSGDPPKKISGNYGNRPI